MLLRTLVLSLVTLLVPSSSVAQVTFTQIAVSGGAAPGVAGGEFSNFSAPSLNAPGDVAFWSTQSTGTWGIFGPTSGAGSSLGLIAQEGTVGYSKCRSAFLGCLLYTSPSPRD